MKEYKINSKNRINREEKRGEEGKERKEEKTFDGALEFPGVRCVYADFCVLTSTGKCVSTVVCLLFVCC